LLTLFFQEPKLAFEDVNANELYPCVMFYSSNPGEKVSIDAQAVTDRQRNKHTDKRKETDPDWMMDRHR